MHCKILFSSFSLVTGYKREKLFHLHFLFCRVAMHLYHIKQGGFRECLSTLQIVLDENSWQFFPPSILLKIRRQSHYLSHNTIFYSNAKCKPYGFYCFLFLCILYRCCIFRNTPLNVGTLVRFFFSRNLFLIFILFYWHLKRSTVDLAKWLYVL